MTALCSTGESLKEEELENAAGPETFISKTMKEWCLALLVLSVVGQEKQIRLRQNTESNSEQPCQYKVEAFSSLQHQPVLTATVNLDRIQLILQVQILKGYSICYFKENSPCCEKVYHATADWLYQFLMGCNGLSASSFFLPETLKHPLGFFFLREMWSKEEGESSEQLHLRLSPGSSRMSILPYCFHLELKANKMQPPQGQAEATEELISSPRGSHKAAPLYLSLPCFCVDKL